MSKNAFEKFSNPAVKGAKKKEMFKQAKRKAKAEAREQGNLYRAAAKAKRENRNGFEATPTTRPKKFSKQEHDSEVNQLKQWANEYGTDKKPSISPKKTIEKPSAAATKSTRKFSKTGPEGRPAVQQKMGSKPATSFVKKAETVNTEMPLNKFVAHAGICGRREAAELVREGKVTVNGDVVYEPGYKVKPTDTVKYNKAVLQAQQKLVYVLLNKPKDFITTTKDPQGRRTVLDLVKDAAEQRIYPVGRLDRNTTGVLLMTNDGDLAQTLTHPSFSVRKIYEAKLDKPFTKKDAEAVANGITLEDGFVQADAIGFPDAGDKCIVGIEIHSGKNRIVRRIFEHLGYDVKNLDRVLFGSLSKKNVDRGKWRFLNEKEVGQLKQMQATKGKRKKAEDFLNENK